MVFQNAQVVLLTLYVHIVETRVFSKRLLAVTHSVTFDIGFCCYINTIFVAEVVPARIIGIVASTNSIYVELLHHLDVLNHAFYTDYITAIRVEFVAVGTLDEHWLSVYEELLVFDFNLAETYILRNALNEFVAIVERNQQFIEVRCFSSPLLSIRDNHYRLANSLIVNLQFTNLLRTYITACRVEKAY